MQITIKKIRKYFSYSFVTDITKCVSNQTLWYFATSSFVTWKLDRCQHGNVV